MSKTKKKTVVKVKVPRTRNLIAKALCSGRQFQSRPFVNRKKDAGEIRLAQRNRLNDKPARLENLFKPFRLERAAF